MPYFEDELWDEGTESVLDGEVVNRAGKPLHLGMLIKRRWGWPKKARCFHLVWILTRRPIGSSWIRLMARAV